jgi:hypothetical protein
MRDKDAVSIHVTPPRFGDEVAILYLPKDHFGSVLKDAAGSEKDECGSATPRNTPPSLRQFARLDILLLPDLVRR